MLRIGADVRRVFAYIARSTGARATIDPRTACEIVASQCDRTVGGVWAEVVEAFKSGDERASYYFTDAGPVRGVEFDLAPTSADEPEHPMPILRMAARFDPRSRFFFLGGLVIGILHDVANVAPTPEHRDRLHALAQELHKVFWVDE